MDDRERMLAEGPRIAPEPQTADTAPAVAAPRAPAARPERSPRSPSLGSRPWLVRLLPFGLFAAVIGAQGLGRYGWVVIIAAVGIAALVRAAHRRSR